MFRIEVFCDDKHLPHVLYALSGLVLGQPTVQPVANAKFKNGEIRAATDGTVVEQFAQYAKAKKIKQFKSTDLKEFTKLIGLAPTSRNYALSQLVKAGAVKKRGTGQATYYVVLS